MPRPDIYNLPAEIIGEFDRSDDFINASEPLLQEMRETHLHWYSNRDSLTMQVNLGDAVDHYKDLETHGGRIYASFLGRIAADLIELVGDEDAMRKLAITPFAPQFHDLAGNGADKMHIDGLQLGAELGIRYLTANRFPTEIPELGTTQPGHIYRISNKHTQHRRPLLPKDMQDPRMLMAINA